MRIVSIKQSARASLAGLALGLGLTAVAPGANAQAIGAGLATGPLPGHSIVEKTYGFAGECQPVDFTGIDIKYNRQMGYYQLTVTGIKKFANMNVSFSHQSYGARPAYWTSMVVGCWKNFVVIPIPTPFYVTMPLTQFVGTRGVEILGATMRVRRNVPRS